MTYDPDSTPNQNPEIEEAQHYWRLGYASQMNGDLEEAIALYRKSIDIHPTAEAHTYLGWTYSFQGKLEEAIDECKIAIDIDPDFGNPYNDIGSYMMRMGKFEEAIPWLEIACNARRYEARYYPHFNLGRVYERLGDIPQALEEYRHAVAIDPNYKQALQAIERLEAWMN
ncbi:MAG: tetratricopeptide repeat protein [Bacteroidetes bacterium]|nr:tetratricopeptide repeat protein [Bacteroidota bacterium]